MNEVIIHWLPETVGQGRHHQESGQGPQRSLHPRKGGQVTFAEQLNEFNVQLDDIARTLWEMDFPHYCGSQEKADAYRASILVSDARSQLQDLEMRIREYGYE